MADAYKVQALRGERLTAWTALHAATRGAAEALDVADEIGTFEPGRVADLVVWDWTAGSVAERRHGVARTLHERVFAWMTLGDDRNVVETRVAGRVLHARPAAAAAAPSASTP
jgi:guanine deaminase